MKKLIFLLIVIAIVVFAGSPLFVAYQLNKAYKAQDGATIAKAIDYPKLKSSVKTQLTGRFANTISQYPMIQKLGGDNLLQFGNEFINNAVEGAITTDNIEIIVISEGQQANMATKQLAGAWAIASNKIDLNGLIKDLLVQRGDVQTVIKQQIKQLSNQQAQQIAGQAQSVQSATDSEPSFAYCGLNCFEIQGTLKGYPLTIQMEREGVIQWKIVDIKLP